MNLFETLSAAIPTKREVPIPGWPVPLWLHRLDLDQLLILAATRPEGESESTPWLLDLLGLTLGDEAGPKDFNIPEAKAWLKKQPAALDILARECLALNELSQPNGERKNV